MPFGGIVSPAVEADELSYSDGRHEGLFLRRENFCVAAAVYVPVVVIYPLGLEVRAGYVGFPQIGENEHVFRLPEKVERNGRKQAFDFSVFVDEGTHAAVGNGGIKCFISITKVFFPAVPVNAPMLIRRDEICLCQYGNVLGVLLKLAEKVGAFVENYAV